jgi:hypothetical protein
MSYAISFHTSEIVVQPLTRQSSFDDWIPQNRKGGSGLPCHLCWRIRFAVERHDPIAAARVPRNHAPVSLRRSLTGHHRPLQDRTAHPMVVLHPRKYLYINLLNITIDVIDIIFAICHAP